MNRMIWIWRMIAILILVIFAILMWNLYARLVEVKRQRGVARPASGTEVSASLTCVLGSRFPVPGLPYSAAKAAGTTAA